MRFLVLGAGRMGRAIAFDLARVAGTSSVRIVDASPSIARALGDELGVRWDAVDLRDEGAVTSLFRESDVAVSAADYSLNEQLTKIAIREKTHLCDLGGNNTVVARQLAMNAEAEKAGVTVVPDCGLAPGLADLLAAHGVGQLGTARSVRIRVGGLPAHPEPPLGYALFFSVRGLTNEYLEEAEVLREGHIERVPSMTEVESIEFPPPLGMLEAFHTSGGASTLPTTLGDRVRNIDYKTIRYPGHAAIVKAMIDLGMLSPEPVRVSGVDVVPRELTEAMLVKSLPRTDEDVVLVRVVVEGERETISYQIVDRRDPVTSHTAMMRTTGYPTAIIAWMLGSGRIQRRGVIPGELCVPLDELITALRERGVAIEIERR